MSEASAWNFNLPVNIVFGCGRVAEAGALAKPYGTKALVVTGSSSTKKSGLLDRVTSSLAEAGIACAIFDRVQQNPLTTTAEAGAAFATENGCDLIVAVGGGSVIDCAKGIAFLAVNDGDISDYIFGRRVSDRALPLMAIPTTCGAGSEGNGFAVLTNPSNGDKKSLRCAAIVPKVSIVDPECMMTMPPRVLASVGFDALCHCMEAYTANKAQPFTDALCLYAIKLLSEHLLPLYQAVAGGTAATSEALRPAWESLCAAATIGGMAIGQCGVTLSHGMEHPASGLKNIVHGQGLAALTPAVTAFIVQKLQGAAAGACDTVPTVGAQAVAAGKFAEIARLLGGSGLSDCADRIRVLVTELGLTASLGDLGLSESDIPWMTANCLKVSAGNLTNTPVAVTEADIAAIYKEAL